MDQIMHGRISRHIECLISPTDWACIEDDETDWNAYIEAAYYTGDIWADIQTNPEIWVMEVVTAQPGVWVAELCRIKHDLPNDITHIAYCGLCREYANPRKRNRAKSLGPPLPGFDSGQYQLHQPCSPKGLTWLRKLTYRLETAGFLCRRREKVPDLRQIRGWDWATRLYKTNEVSQCPTKESPRRFV